jgi:hypothetical protein
MHPGTVLTRSQNGFFYPNGRNFVAGIKQSPLCNENEMNLEWKFTSFLDFSEYQQEMPFWGVIIFPDMANPYLVTVVPPKPLDVY